MNEILFLYIVFIYRGCASMIPSMKKTLMFRRLERRTVSNLRNRSNRDIYTNVDVAYICSSLISSEIVFKETNLY